ncbi:DUF4238 domain-containing protein [Salinibaculum salinum]|uniref:DUF4238 domain-containing protein n=1 Tax=Salinibaculum salinum TaxID=3131996 RepID=UPI0030EBE8EF
MSEEDINEHYVPQSYLRLFSPPGRDIISRYSLKDKHGGGEYYPPYDEYSIKTAASEVGFADGWLEGNDVTEAENEMIGTIRKLRDRVSLTERDISSLSGFIAFQKSRTPTSKLHFEGRQLLGDIIDNKAEFLDFDLDQGWETVVTHNANSGHEALQHMGWVLIENDTSTPFITSDDPIVHYFDCPFEEVDTAIFQMENREIYCPLGPDLLLVLLDPSVFDVGSQYPSTDIQRVAVDDAVEINKVNFLQTINAFREIFGPVDYGDYLEDIVETLCDRFPDEAYIRGPARSLREIEVAQRVGSGHIESEKEKEWYLSKGREITRSRQKKTRAIWEFKHEIGLIESLRLDKKSLS